MGNIFGTAVNVVVGAKVMKMASEIRPRKREGCKHGKKKSSR